MKRCPITYEIISEEERYSAKGLKIFSPRLKYLDDFPWTAEEQRAEARRRADKISIQGVQPKLSARLAIAKQGFEITDTGGTYIIKPQNDLYPELPENEDVSMRMAELAGIEVPLHGLLHCKDGSFSYFIKRFDRFGKGGKRPLEDFAQLSGARRSTKYNSSMEQVGQIVDRYCSFPVLEKKKLFERVLFNFLIGNEDMHLKNFSLIEREEKVELAPAYDFLNSTIIFGSHAEEIALPIAGKKKKITRSLLDDYARLQMELNEKIVSEIYANFFKTIPRWFSLIEISFLSEKMKVSYRELVQERRVRLEL